jgi:uncharacterized protein (DUF2147 family)
MNFRYRAFVAVAIAAQVTLSSSAAQAQPARPDDIIGRWNAVNGALRIEMFKAGAEYQARILWGDRIVERDGVTYKRDTRNPDPALRSRSLQNIVFIRGLTWKDGRWSGGSLYDGSSGATRSVAATTEGGRLVLRVTAGPLSRTIPMVRAP